MSMNSEGSSKTGRVHIQSVQVVPAAMRVREHSGYLSNDCRSRCLSANELKTVPSIGRESARELQQTGEVQDQERCSMEIAAAVAELQKRKGLPPREYR